MNQAPQMYEMVALLEPTPTSHFETHQPLLLRRGQIGAVVEVYGDGACEVEFSDSEGRTYALLPVPPDKLIVLHDSPAQAAA